MSTHFVTGATSGIGEVLARQLHDRGDDLVLLARNDDKATRLAEAFPGCRTVVADLAGPEALSDAIPVDLPDLDSVVHAAGVVDVALVAESSAESLAQTVVVNLVAPMLLTRALLEPVRRARGTHVFVNSGSGINANPQWASYNASKFGLRGFAAALGQEEAAHGVRVSSVFPGRTATAMQQQVHEQEGKEYDATEWIRPETVAGSILRIIDLGRDATVPEVVIRPNRG
ncbi:MAG TPA: SDR family oxidoreductase [Marmoricola sp.]|jgi:short-subunit dehydrogenase|nr:SDR family oxidoreductase [Marmoricola sp.]